MTIRGNAVGESLTRTTSLPAMNGFTIMAWFRLGADRNAVSTLINAGSSTGAEEKTIKTAADGTTLNLWNGATLITGGTALVAAGAWVHVALVYDGTASPDVCRSYTNGVLNLTADAVGLTDPTGKIWIGDNVAGEWANLQYSAIKVFSAVLTVDDILAEMRQFLPVRFDTLNCWTPGTIATTLTGLTSDYSGNANHWTENGTLGYDPTQPPIPWKSGKQRRVTTTAGGVAITIAIPKRPAA
jgi:hypothetical protein